MICHEFGGPSSDPLLWMDEDISCSQRDQRDQRDVARARSRLSSLPDAPNVSQGGGRARSKGSQSSLCLFLAVSSSPRYHLQYPFIVLITHARADLAECGETKFQRVGSVLNLRESLSFVMLLVSQSAQQAGYFARSTAFAPPASKHQQV